MSIFTQYKDINYKQNHKTFLKKNSVLSSYILYQSLSIKKKDLPKRTGPIIYIREPSDYSLIAACAAAKRAIGTLNGEHDT